MQINRMTEPTHKGRHPEYTHLVFIEADPYYDKYKIRTPAIPGASTLMNEWDLKKTALGDQWNDEFGDQFGFIPDEYLELFEKNE